MKALIAAILAGAFALPVMAQNTATVDRNGPTAGEAVRRDAADAKAATKRGAHKIKRKAHHAKQRTKAAGHRAKARAES
jgi:hypothetical protein